MRPIKEPLSMYPEIAKEFDCNKNTPLTPETIGHGYDKNVWWICPRGHSYQARPDHRTGRKKSGCSYCANKKPIKGETDLLSRYPDIAIEWDYKKNDKAPEEYLPQSNKVVFWKCRYCGYSFPKKISARIASKAGCPNCNKEKGTSFPEQSIFYYLSKVFLAESRAKVYGKEVDVFIPSLNVGIEYNGKYYHTQKLNRDARKYDYLRSKGLRIIIVFEGDKKRIDGDTIELESYPDGHPLSGNLEWAIKELFNMLHTDCPTIDLSRDQIKIKEQYIVSKKLRNFATVHPRLSRDWDYELNGELKPEAFLPNSNHMVWWKCAKCGFSYSQSLNNRANGEGCPVCAGKRVEKGFNDLATTRPDLAEEWSVENEICPDEVLKGSHIKVKWKCRICGNQWEARVYSRNSGKGCPACAGRKLVKTQ